MSQGRFPAAAGWCTPSKLPKGPNDQARHVFERDKGVCAICHVDTVAAWHRAKQLLRDARHSREDVVIAALIEYAYRHGFITKKALKDLNPPSRILVDGLIKRRRPWDMDHTVPVAEGGGACGIDGLRSLCIPCHRNETAALKKRLAEKRRVK